MKILYFSLKGGVGKSSLSLNHSQYLGVPYITNDISTYIDKNEIKDFYQIEHSKKRLPKTVTRLEDAIFDFGAMSSAVDAKVTQAVKICDAVIIPTLCDVRSLEATMHTYEFIRQDAKQVIFIINNYTDTKKLEFAYDWIKNRVPNAIIFNVRKTTLFERVARDGMKWFENVGHRRGEHMLQKSKRKHELMFSLIETIVKDEGDLYVA
jgi:hypothetical protein